MTHLRHGRPHRIRGWALFRSRGARLAQRRYMRLLHYVLSVYDGADDLNDLLLFQAELFPSHVAASPRRKEIVVKLSDDKVVVTLRTDKEFDAWFAAFSDAARQFGDFYKLVDTKRLGTGAFSTVYFGFDKDDGHHVAVKYVDKTISSRIELSYAHTEVRMMAFVNHPCIVQCLDIFDSPASMYVVMPYMSANTLEQRMIDTPPKKRPLPESVAATIMSRLLDALAYLEAENICHRDVKPDNILLTAHPNENLWATTACLCDFGLAAFVDSETELTDIVGTPNYLAPEVISRHPHDNQRIGYGPPVDVWAAGVIMFWLLSGGQLPFDAPDSAMVLKNIRTRNLQLVADPWHRVSDDAKSLLCSLLHPNPRTRLRASAARVHPWLRHSQYVLPLTLRTLNYRRTRSSSPRIRWRVAIIAVLSVESFAALVDEERIADQEDLRRMHLERVAERRRVTQRRGEVTAKAPERAPAGADGLGYNVGLIPSFAPKRKAKAGLTDNSVLRKSTSLSVDRGRFMRVSVESGGSTRSCSADSERKCIEDGGSDLSSSSSTRSGIRGLRLRSRRKKDSGATA
ncbi:unnamed protein product [Agarophyton chilense]|eukprot:gb/GEZJ01005147.1/.p1 GENE.gb/GEZJ01005147.1/~~gb/GEZJ01005147.1/.p1  ORF type:complete len:572 (-),score=51.44 gb/GEZJ01005147.1/:1393-3108(-)